MQQPRPISVEPPPQVEVERALGRLMLEPQPSCRRAQVGRQRHCGHVGRHGAEGLADDQPVEHEPGGGLLPLAQHRAGGLHHLGETGERTPPHGRERLGQPDGLDHVRAGDGQVVLAQQRRDPRHPAGDHAVRRGEQVVVPPWEVMPAP